ncbi:hypothetical protein ATK17_1267 [Branchiibius hedensis]|uniref:Uncharacterized protein n=1 Tax=Branchiibius hedensis TaxID=672460 RepID=A0A2Y8ZNR8_9MICO|nr:hypothetical protein [Branchiibius hedensis]PWJ25155.1 hypothetical protein ATK17_1267 [Branchiibius hedensis]SSA33970.1 hypothetical protein SAMN04489750_1267 [Branchiibius hedensis]
MRSIANYDAEKYAANPSYAPVEPGIYLWHDEEDTYVTSLSFEQEPELGEGDNAAWISQYPLEDLLDRFLVWVSDFYPALNTADSRTCYQEFAAPDLADIQALREIIGRHVYLKNNGAAVDLVIE